MEPRKPILHHLHDYFFPHERNGYRPHIFSLASIAVLVLAVIVFEAGYLVQTKVVFLKTDFLASVLPGTLVALVNQDRSSEGLSSVVQDTLLNRAAQAAAEDMAAKGYFAHVSPDGKTPWYWLNLVGYRFSYAGQNLAVNFTDSQNVETAWMNSPTHRANIEKPQYTQVGIGTANGVYEGKDTTFVVEFFATPAIAKAVKASTANVAATPVLPITKTPTSTQPSQVLGSETQVVTATLPPAPTTQMNWFTFMLASPFTTLQAILTFFFVIIAISFAVAIFMRGREQHPTVFIGGTLLLLIISGTMLAVSLFGSKVQISPRSQHASAEVMPQ